MCIVEKRWMKLEIERDVADVAASVRTYLKRLVAVFRSEALVARVGPGRIKT